MYLDKYIWLCMRAWSVSVNEIFLNREFSFIFKLECAWSRLHISNYNFYKKVWFHFLLTFIWSFFIFHPLWCILPDYPPYLLGLPCHFYLVIEQQQECSKMICWLVQWDLNSLVLSYYNICIYISVLSYVGLAPT